jgi:hypothetical protein
MSSDCADARLPMSTTGWTTPDAYQVQVTAALVWWEHRNNCRAAHCLVRRITNRAGDHVFVLSEIASNPVGMAIRTDIAGAITIAARHLGWINDLSAATWLLHHGDFSHPEPAIGETLARIHAAGPPWATAVILGQPTRLDPHDARLLLGGLAPVHEVLRTLAAGS